MRRRWTSRLPFNSYECELWVMPWNLNGNHWNVCVLELRNSRMVVYESMRMGVSAGQALKEVLRQVVDGAVRHACTFSPLRGWDFKEPVNWEFLVVYGNPQPCGSDPALNNQCALYAVAHCREVVVCTPALLPSTLAPSFALCLTRPPWGHRRAWCCWRCSFATLSVGCGRAPCASPGTRLCRRASPKQSLRLRAWRTSTASC